LDPANVALKKPVNLPGGAAAPQLTDGIFTLGEPLETDWIELDLGEERNVAEVRIQADGEFWPEFEIQFVRPGGRQSDARVWAREFSWPWTLRNRADVQNGNRTVAYRSTASRTRIIRILNKGAAKSVRVGEIEVRTTP
jgi:hypothetical protein